MRTLLRSLLACAALLPAAAAAEQDALVAVATNFLATARTLEQAFETGSGHDIRLAGGSTGKLTAQIAAGAPYEAFLAADAERPAWLERQGFAAPGSRFAYALGRLALWSAEPGRVGRDGAATLAEGAFRRLAIANPTLAPYGAAAMETLERLGLATKLRARLVQGENVGQAHALVATGNAELGLVALPGAAEAGGSLWPVPDDLHQPIRQEAVLLARADPDGAAAAFLAFLQTDAARAAIAADGYGLP